MPRLCGQTQEGAEANKQSLQPARPTLRAAPSSAGRAGRHGPPETSPENPSGCLVALCDCVNPAELQILDFKRTSCSLVLLGLAELKGFVIGFCFSPSAASYLVSAQRSSGVRSSSGGFRVGWGTSGRLCKGFVRGFPPSLDHMHLQSDDAGGALPGRAGAPTAVRSSGGRAKSQLRRSTVPPLL